MVKSTPSSSERSTDAEDYQSVRPSLAVMPKAFADGHVIPRHSHIRDQLLFAVTGVMRVNTDLHRWVVPPDRALLVPAGLEHSVEIRGDVQMRTLYISPRVPTQVKILNVTPLLRELIAALAMEPMDFLGIPRAELIAELINVELDETENQPLNIPLPRDVRLQKLCLRLMENPALNASLDEFADEVGASPKTLARLCTKELGMGFSEWRRRIRFSAALDRLEQGELIKTVAQSCGYNSASAFAYAFKKEFSACPSEFQSSSILIRRQSA